jgi:predicted  nucleic acid-binding Zn-ribbon protein
MELAYAEIKGPVMDRTVELKLKDVIHNLQDKICATNKRPKRAPPRDYDTENELRRQIDALKRELGDGDERIRKAKRKMEEKDDMIDQLGRRQRALVCFLILYIFL